MATSNGLHRYISQMEEGLLELTQNLSVFLSHEFDLEEKYARDKRRLLEETHGLNLDTQKFLKRLSRRMLDEEQAIVHYFHLIKRWYCHLLLLIAYINYTPYVSRTNFMPTNAAQVGKLKSPLSFVSSVGQSRQEQPPPSVRRKHTQLSE
ncbi:hypothetical protein ACTXT7_017403 [Hymenolepis weldensis]